MKRIGNTVGKRDLTAQIDDGSTSRAEETLAIIDGIRASVNRIDSSIMSDFASEVLNDIYNSTTTLLEYLDPEEVFTPEAWYK